ncbi:MAG: outer membrane lipoprotein-sorting protein [Bacteroidota bacterium]
MKFKLALMLTGLIAFSLKAQTVDEILNQHIENSGGKEAWSSIESIEIEAKMVTPQGEMAMSIKQAKPDHIYSEINMMGQKIIQGYDGTTAWMINPMTGNTEAQEMPEPLKQQLLANSQSMDSDWIDYKAKGHEVTLEGNETIDGVETYKIKLVKNKNNDKPESTAYFFFDTENYIPIVTRVSPTEGPTAGMTIETKLSDYKETNIGVLMPFHMETAVMGQSTQMVFEEVTMNADIDESIFKMPGK